MKHLVISGTGRAGTSFLVQWLGASGLDVGEFGPQDYHPEARAGYERNLLQPDLPYVVKDPWLWTYCADVDPDMVEVLVLPVRRLYDAAESRVRVERAAGAKRSHWGWTNGGVLCSLDPFWQSRILAFGFYELVQWAVDNDIPIQTLAYPRLVQSAAYAVDRLADWLPNHNRALEAHRMLSTA